MHGLADIAKVAAGDDHSAALSKDGRTVYTWGRGEHGQLGRRQKLFVGAPGKSERLSTKNSEEVAIHDVFAYGNCTATLDVNGEVIDAVGKCARIRQELIAARR